MEFVNQDSEVLGDIKLSLDFAKEETEQEQEPEEELKDIKLSLEFANILTSISHFKKNLTGLQQNIRILEKNVKVKYNKLKSKKKTVEKPPSGFAKPMKISNNLCTFLDKNEGTELARTDVTRALIKYIEVNQLQDTSNKRVINPDAKLKCLLGLEDVKDDNSNPQITYFNIQKYMNQHFINTKPYKKLLNNESIST